MSSDFEPTVDREASDLDADPTGGPTPCAYTEYVRGGDAEGLPATGEDADGLERAVWDALYEVEDPEMPVSVVDLGLIYGVELAEHGVESEDDETTDDGDAKEDDGDVMETGATGTHATVYMTLTYTGCPARDMLTDEIREAAASPEGVDAADVELVWSPEWSLEMVTEQGKADLREFGLSV